MLTFILVVISCITWFTLSTLVYYTLFNFWDFDDENPLAYLAITFSPVGILALIGILFGEIIFKKFEKKLEFIFNGKDWLLND